MRAREREVGGKERNRGHKEREEKMEGTHSLRERKVGSEDDGSWKRRKKGKRIEGEGRGTTEKPRGRQRGGV
jgi:hypothetical protein